jgi:fatty acid desaturase
MLRFLSRLLEALDKLHIRLEESWSVVVNVIFFAQRLHQLATFAKVVTRQSRVQVVLDLELKTAMEPIHPPGTIHVHGCLQLHLEPFVRFVSGILHVQICISHFAMDTYHGNAYNDESDEWFKMQLKTTMNVDCPSWMDWFHGGLQFQIEHHLYPRLPRHNLRECSKLVKALCKKYNLHYHAPGFFQANVELLQCLKQTANEAQNLKKGDGGFYESAIWESLNARG